jgi:hypothetical protein
MVMGRYWWELSCIYYTLHVCDSTSVPDRLASAKRYKHWSWFLLDLLLENIICLHILDDLCNPMLS